MADVKEREDKYLFGEMGNKFFIKLVGNATMKNSKTLDDLFIKLLKEDKKEIILDLEECNYMDSTVLGVIAKNAVKVKKLWQNSIAAINPQSIIQVGFKSTGIDKLLDIIEGEKIKIEMEKIDNVDYKDKEAKSRHILESHKMLMELNEDNKKVFKNVVELLEKELSK